MSVDPPYEFPAIVFVYITFLFYSIYLCSHVQWVEWSPDVDCLYIHPFCIISSLFPNVIGFDSCHLSTDTCQRSRGQIFFFSLLALFFKGGWNVNNADILHCTCAPVHHSPLHLWSWEPFVPSIPSRYHAMPRSRYYHATITALTTNPSASRWAHQRPIPVRHCDRTNYQLDQAPNSRHCPQVYISDHLR
jgi:hypothetical protein